MWRKYAARSIAVTQFLSTLEELLPMTPHEGLPDDIQLSMWWREAHRLGLIKESERLWLMKWFLQI